MNEGAKNRLKLWLRSERAFGLPSVAAPSAAAASALSAEAAEPRELGRPASADAGAASEPAPPSARAPLKAPEMAPRQGGAAVIAPVSPEGDGYTPEALFAPDANQPPFDAPPLTSQQKRERFVAMDDKEVRGCTKCRLCETRTKTVFGEGDPDARIFFIGEGPGENEDLTGRPFVGRAGDMLNKWIAAMGLAREQVFIANIVKCRPPGNRVPAPDEVATCTPYLQRQLEIVRPQVIITLGLPSTKYMLQSRSTMGKLRGQWHDWRGIRLMPTFHPAYVLRNPSYDTRAAVWSDLQQVMAELQLPAPKKGEP